MVSQVSTTLMSAFILKHKERWQDQVLPRRVPVLHALPSPTFEFGADVGQFLVYSLHFRLFTFTWKEKKTLLLVSHLPR